MKRASALCVCNVCLVLHYTSRCSLAQLSYIHAHVADSGEIATTSPLSLASPSRPPPRLLFSPPPPTKKKSNVPRWPVVVLKQNSFPWTRNDVSGGESLACSNFRNQSAARESLQTKTALGLRPPGFCGLFPLGVEAPGENGEGR